MVEWFDQNADLVREFYLKWFTDGNIEMTSTKDNSKFLKKIGYKDLSKDQLYIGGSVTIFSRQLHIVDYGDERTRKVFEVNRGRTFGVVTPAGYNQMGEVMIAARDAGMVISQLKMIRLSRDEVSQFSGWSRDWTQDVVLAMELVDDSANNCATTWASAVDKLNSKYGKEIAYAARPGSALDEARAIFGQEGRASTAVYDNCSLVVIRPQAVKDGKAGAIIDAILEKGWEISAVEMYNLSKSTAADFFSVYKGVVINYETMIQNMTSGACIALQIRGSDIVTEIREFAGPVDVEIAQELYPDSLRARFGVGPGAGSNAVHCTDLPEDGILECKYFFSLLNS